MFRLPAISNHREYVTIGAVGEGACVCVGGGRGRRGRKRRSSEGESPQMKANNDQSCKLKIYNESRHVHI